MRPQTLRPKSIQAVRSVAARPQRRIPSVRPYVAVASRSRAARGTALSVSDAANVAPRYVPTKPEAKKPKKQIITVAVDGSDNSAAGLIFLLDTFSGTGSTVNVVHVVNNDRSANVGIGTLVGMRGSPLTVSLAEEFSDKPSAGYVERKVAAAQNMMTEMYLPHLEAADIEFSVNVHVVEGQRSAAGIAEQVVQAATNAGSDLLAVTSHGGGLHCSYGSVARYVTQHFSRAIMLLPPNMDSFAHRDSKTVCFGVNTLSELQDSMTWALRNFSRAGDTISVLRAPEETMTGRAAGSDQTSIMLGLQEQIEKHSIDDIAFDLIQPDFESASAQASLDCDEDNCTPLQNKVTADELLHVADAKGARALVMTNYASKGFMQEMMFGTLALLVSRNAPLPLLLTPPGHCFE